jgi:hypothetical protein
LVLKSKVNFNFRFRAKERKKRMILSSKEFACPFISSEKFLNNIILKKFEKVVSKKFSIEKILIQLLTISFLEERLISSHNMQDEYMKQITEVFKFRSTEQNKNNPHNIDSALLFINTANLVTNLKK